MLQHNSSSRLWRIPLTYTLGDSITRDKIKSSQLQTDKVRHFCNTRFTWPAIQHPLSNHFNYSQNILLNSPRIALAFKAYPPNLRYRKFTTTPKMNELIFEGGPRLGPCAIGFVAGFIVAPILEGLTIPNGDRERDEYYVKQTDTPVNIAIMLTNMCIPPILAGYVSTRIKNGNLMSAMVSGSALYLTLIAFNEASCSMSQCNYEARRARVESEFFTAISNAERKTGTKIF